MISQVKIHTAIYSFAMKWLVKYNILHIWRQKLGKKFKHVQVRFGRELVWGGGIQVLQTTAYPT